MSSNETLRAASTLVSALVSRIDLATQSTDQILTLLETLQRGIYAHNQSPRADDHQRQFLSTRLLLTLDAINVELASRANELSVAQIGNMCISIVNLIDTFSC